MHLYQLIQEFPGLATGGLPDLEITKVTADSRQVAPGAMFVAVRGMQTDGHRFLRDAVRRGAAVLVGEEPNAEYGVPYLQVPDSRHALAQAAAAWHDYPARKLVMIGVTGTDGKTTTSNLIYQILQCGGIQAGLITSVNAIIGDRTLDTGLHVTTPGPLEVQAYLAEMVQAGLTHCILETTSHGLAQKRVAACEFDLGVVTNITHEHLDYHGSFESYQAAKAQLLIGLAQSAPKAIAPERTAIINRDDESYDYLHQVTTVPQVSYGRQANADVRARQIQIGPEGLRFRVEGREYSQAVQCSLLGAYNLSNCLAAFATAVEGLGTDPEIAAQGIEAFKSVPGRMERIEMGQSFIAIVDFAHTPNALAKALETVRQLTEGQVIAVFGSAGLRDREKRRLMAKVSIRHADRTILTAEDPRTESLGDILEEMAAGARAEGGQEGIDFWRIEDRGEAIRFALHLAKDGDVVIACGKGHEQSMCFGETEYPWDDRVALRAALAEMLGVERPRMPQLPTKKADPHPPAPSPSRERGE
jgi:UDP-N-acetylmuramoyl-L-alanyl-D-glutamate--2,6-diaminopimelate ligase